MAKSNGHLEVKRFVSDQGKNQYLLISGKEAAVIDVSDAAGEVGELIDEMGLTLKYLLVSHAHQSHVAALPRLKEKFGAAFCLHEYEYQHLKETNVTNEPDQILQDNDTLKLGDIKIKVLLTAGHTKGSVCFWIKTAKALFSGSTLLKKDYPFRWYLCVYNKNFPMPKFIYSSSSGNIIIDRVKSIFFDFTFKTIPNLHLFIGVAEN